MSGKERQILQDFTYMWNQKKEGRNPTSLKKEIRFAVTRGERWGLGELNESGQKVNISACKINEHWEYSIQHDNYS